MGVSTIQLSYSLLHGHGIASVQAPLAAFVVLTVTSGYSRSKVDVVASSALVLGDLARHHNTIPSHKP